MARGEPPSDVLARARAAVPAARVSIMGAGDAVAVVVDEDVTAPVPILRGLSITLTSRVAVPRESS